jgi:HlyD family secretion protein
LKTLRWIVAALLLAGAVFLLARYLGNVPPEVPFAAVRRGALSSAVVTNGQVEPVAGMEIRASLAGQVVQIYAEQGQTLAAGEPILRLDLPGAQAELEDAEAALLAAQALLRQAEDGGTPLQRRELSGRLAEARVRLQHAETDAGAIRRLVGANAATTAELDAEEARVQLAKEQVNSLEAQLAALSSDSDQQQARATIAAAKARVDAARRVADGAVLKSAASGVLYEFLPRRGTWLQPGDLVGRVGKLDTLSVLVFVDEPELGRLRPGIPVTIRWDALPNEQWQGQIDRVPTRIQSFGTRQVGEVLCRIENPKGNLLPGANVNAELLTAQVESTLLVPRQAIRRRMGEEGVWLLVEDRLRWRTVRLGVTNVTEAEILDGLAEGDRIALLVDKDLREDMVVQPLVVSPPSVR